VNGSLVLNDELERMWKYMIVNEIEVLPVICLKGLRKASESLKAEI
jgi:hypothetical protein